MDFEPAAPTAENADGVDKEPHHPGLSRHHALWRDVVEIVLLIVTIYTLVNLATARAVVEGQSMQPNFYTGQLVIVNRFAYYFTEPQRGDVIVLHDPKDPSQDFIKRVMALPNETVQIQQGRVYINGDTARARVHQRSRTGRAVHRGILQGGLRWHVDAQERRIFRAGR